VVDIRLTDHTPGGLSFASWFLGVWVNDLVTGHRIDSQAEKQLGPAPGSPAVEPERERYKGLRPNCGRC
jgi:hypothetical protein